MNDIPTLAPLLERAILAERTAGYWRGVVHGALGVVLVLLLAWGTSLAVAQEIPRIAHEYKRDIIREGRAVWGMGAPTATFAGQIHQESYWRADALSRVGAAGLAQFMPRTAQWISEYYSDSLGANAPLDPRWSIRALIIYDKYLWNRVVATTDCERMAFALSGYNGGLGWVHKRKQLSTNPLVCFFATCDINPGIHPANQRENQEYPRRILLRHEPVYAAAGFGLPSCGG